MTMAGEDWSGRVGQSWATQWERTDRTFAPLTERLVATAVAQFPVGSDRQMRALDIGCGAGETALALADARPDIDVTGLDLSEDLVAVAQSRAEGRFNCRFVAGDASAWTGETPFDAALSRHGVMFFADPVAAFTHLRELMAPGAPLVFSCFRDRALNPWSSIALSLLPTPPPPSDPHAPGPFAFADPARVAAILEAAGWRDVEPTEVDYRYVAGAGDDPVEDAISLFSRIGPAAPLIAALSDEERAAFKVRFAEVLSSHARNGEVGFPAAAWLWQARA